MPVGATDLALYVGTVSATPTKVYYATKAEIAAGQITGIGAKFDAADSVTAYPAATDGYYYAAAILGN